MQRGPNVKEEKSDYVIYYPYPCTHLPPIGADIPPEGCLCVSIDVGIKNFAIRLEKRYATGYIETVYMDRIDFRQYGDANETTGTTKINPQILAASTMVLQTLLPHMLEARIIGIERQMAVNYKASRMFQHVLTFFLLHVTHFKNYCIIMDIDPKLKGRVLGAPKGINKTGLKKWSLEHAIVLFNRRNDQLGLSILMNHRGKAETKGDDMADTNNQMEAWFVLNGGVHTSQPLTITM